MSKSEIVLPPELEGLTVDEIPEHISAALHPGANHNAVTTVPEARALARANDAEQHKAQLARFIRSGELRTYGPSMTRLAPNEGTFPFARILVADFIGYLKTNVPIVRVRIDETARSGPATALSGASEIEWIKIARTEGQKIHKASPKLNAAAIAERVRQKLVAMNVAGRGGKVPSASTIKRHALRGYKN
jgi:hypothetical protein